MTDLARVLSVSALLMLAPLYAAEPGESVHIDEIATLKITFENAKGEAGRLYLRESGLSRLELDKHNAHYLLLDLNKPDVWMVDMGRQEVTHAHELLFTGSAIPYGLREQGDGPEIAGMATRVFEISDIRGNDCARYYVAPAAVEQDSRLALMGQFISQMAVNPGRTLPAIGPLAAGFISPCVRAELDALPELARHGTPVQRIKQDGEVAFRITAINPTATLPACRLALPEDYSSRTPAQVAVEALKNSLLRRKRPDTDHITLDDCP